MDFSWLGKDLHWWNGLTGIAGAVLLACIGKDWTNGAIMASGACAFGIGQWIDHPVQTTIGNFGTGHGIVTGHPYRWSVAGLVFTVGGILTAAFGIGRSLFF